MVRQKRIGWILFVVIILGVGGFAIAPYLLFDPALSRIKLNSAVPYQFPLLLVHIFISFIALGIGWIQFIPSLRQKQARIHRFVGRIYLGCIAIGGATGIVVGLFEESYIRQLAFWTLAVLWLFTGWKGYRSALRRNFEAHRSWMIRNYAMTMVAVSARIVTPICILLYFAAHGNSAGGDIAMVLGKVLEVNIWLGLVINVVISEWTLQSYFRKQ
ncbi:DUF2306 domain-containing protein [Paenibacillus sp. GCM10027628]|uniref:DUF2306 domain-containing protein n=1 Tax=Paenibacillus sp. GCM10027628 TaxID=3273413 RepID=UPI003642732C